MCKIFSRSVNEFRLFQQPDLSFHLDNVNLRTKRAVGQNETTRDHADFIHSQNNNLSTTSFSLHGELDNEAFVHWTGEGNNVSNLSIIYYNLV